jgi:hypothetical protein
MTEKDIVRLAEEAELWLHTDRKYEAVEKFAKLVAAEREACAKVCDVFAVSAFDDEAGIALNIQKSIRARGQV